MTEHFIRQWRVKRGYSERELARRMKVPWVISHASISRIEKGLQSYSAHSLGSIARGLDLQTWMLFVEPDDGTELAGLISKLTPEKKRLAIAMVKALTDAE